MIGGINPGQVTAALGLLEAFSNPNKVRAALKDIQTKADRLEATRKDLGERERTVKKAEADLKASEATLRSERETHDAAVSAFTKKKRGIEQGFLTQRSELSAANLVLEEKVEQMRQQEAAATAIRSAGEVALADAEKAAQKAETMMAEAVKLRDKYESRAKELRKHLAA